MANLEPDVTCECAVPLLDVAPRPSSPFKTHLQEALEFCISAAPISVQCVNYSIYIAIIQMWVGHLSTAGLAAITLGVQLNRALGFFLVHYLTSSMETIAGQAIGAREFHVVGVTFQRVLLMNAVFLIPLVITSFNSEQLLLHLHQDPKIAAKVQEYLVKSLPGSLCQVLCDVCFRYMSLNSYMWPITVAQLIGIITGLFSGAVMIKIPESAVHGAAVSTIAYSGSMLPLSVIGVLLLHRASGKETPETKIWHGFSRAAFQGWGHYLRVGGGAVLMFTPKQFFMEYLFLLTGTLREHAAPSTAIGLSMGWVVTTQGFAVGFNLSAMGKIGGAIGSGNLALAKLRVKSYMIVALVISGLLSAGLVIFENEISRLYTSDPVVLVLLLHLKWPSAVSILFMWTGMVSLGILGGFRRHFWGACVAIPSFLIFGFGMAPVLILVVGWGTLGASLSFTSVMACESLVLFILLCGMDYEREYDRVEESMKLSRPLD